jgi:hypothetical protein
MEAPVVLNAPVTVSVPFGRNDHPGWLDTPPSPLTGCNSQSGAPPSHGARRLLIGVRGSETLTTQRGGQLGRGSAPGWDTVPDWKTAEEDRAKTPQQFVTGYQALAVAAGANSHQLCPSVASRESRPRLNPAADCRREKGQMSCQVRSLSSSSNIGPAGGGNVRW